MARPAKRVRPGKTAAVKTAKASNVKPKARPAKGAKAHFAPTRTYQTTSTFSPRVEQVYEELDAEMRRLFPDVERVFDYGGRGWRVPRKVRIESWKGTMDPNWFLVYVAERAHGITVHIWNPCEYGFLKRRAKELVAAGFKPMVGCIQYTRRGPYPVEAVKSLLREVGQQLAAETPQ